MDDQRTDRKRSELDPLTKKLFLGGAICVAIIMLVYQRMSPIWVFVVICAGVLVAMLATKARKTRQRK